MWRRLCLIAIIIPLLIMVGAWFHYRSFRNLTDSMVVGMLQNFPNDHGGGHIAAADGRFLYDLVIRNGYVRGLEIGTSNGYSSLWLGLALKQNRGHLITIEIDPATGFEAQRNFQKAGLASVIDSRINDAAKEIPQLEGDFDFVFIDAGSENNGKFTKLVYPRISPGGAIIVHNAGNSEFLESLQSDPNLETSLHRPWIQRISVSYLRRHPQPAPRD